MAVIVERDEQRRRLVARVDSVITIQLVLEFLRTARGSPETHDWPLLFDGRGATSALTDADVETAVAMVRDAKERRGVRAHAALIADDDDLFRWLLRYEKGCADVGVNVIRAFRRLDDAEAWLDVMSSTRRFQ